MDTRLISLIEKIGCVDEHGHHLYGTSALLHVLHSPLSSIDPKMIDAGKRFIHEYLNA